MLGPRSKPALSVLLVAWAATALTALAWADDVRTATALATLSLISLAAIAVLTWALHLTQQRQAAAKRKADGKIQSLASLARRQESRLRTQKSALEQEAQRLVQTRLLLDDERARLTNARISLHELERQFDSLSRHHSQDVLPALTGHSRELESMRSNIRALEAASKVPPTIRTDPGHRITRAEAGIHDRLRSPAELAALPTVDWIHDPRSTDPAVSKNPFDSYDRAELARWVTNQTDWRFHHHIDELRGADNLYAAYVRRVEAMLDLCDAALVRSGIEDLAGLSAVDLASSEGFVAHHLMRRGLSTIDCLELNREGIQRQLAIQSRSALTGPRIGRLDLEATNWSAALGRYDVVLALGIVYHLENPMLFARNVFEITDKVAIVESDTPTYPFNNRFRGNGTIYLNRDQVTLSEGDIRYLTEMRPDRVALAQLFLSAGFAAVEFMAPQDEDSYFSTGEKSVMLCYKA